MSNLMEVLDTNTLTSIQNKISNALDISVVVADLKGNRIGNMVDCTKFCKLINSSKKGANLCKQSKSRFHKIYNDHKNNNLCECHMGVKNCIYPIVADNDLLGNIVIGQFFIDEDYFNENLIDTDRISKKFDIDKQKLDISISQIPIISMEKVKKILNHGEFIADFLGEMALKNIFHDKIVHLEQELNKENLKTLESQINPHFLFNTLNSISRMALLENSPDTVEMVYCLSDLLRYSLKEKEDFPTIENEIDNVKKYLFIQSIRYKDRLSFDISIPDEILNFRIPSMILQPIVENAIIHGIEPKSSGGNVYICATFNGDDIKIVVKDTGVGISTKKLKELKDNNYQNFGIGTSNPQNRLVSYFGENYGLNIYSTKYIETIVEINIPCFSQLSLNIV